MVFTVTDGRHKTHPVVDAGGSTVDGLIMYQHLTWLVVVQPAVSLTFARCRAAWRRRLVNIQQTITYYRAAWRRRLVNIHQQTITYYWAAWHQSLVNIHQQTIMYYQAAWQIFNKLSCTTSNITFTNLPPVEEQSIVMGISVCVREHISRTTCPTITKFLVHVTYGCGKVLPCQRCHMLCIHSCMDNIMIVHNLAHLRPLHRTTCVSQHFQLGTVHNGQE